MNLMSLDVFKQLGLIPLEQTTMQLLMADHTVKKPIGISFEVFVKVDNFIFLADFVIMDYEVDFQIPIILERALMDPFRAMVDIEKKELKIRVNNDKVTFNVR